MILDWASAAWASIPEQLVIRSFTEMGVTNTGLLDKDALHSKLKKLLDEAVFEAKVDEDKDEEVDQPDKDPEDECRITDDEEEEEDEEDD